jgi:hypothetical protein
VENQERMGFRNSIGYRPIIYRGRGVWPAASARWMIPVFLRALHQDAAFLEGRIFFP